MLFGLRHDAFVGGNDKNRHVNSANPGQHVFHKFLMPRHVNNAEFNAVRQGQKRKADVNGDSALLLFFETVGVYPGQGFNQRGFAMINMACGPNDNVFYHSVLMA